MLHWGESTLARCVVEPVEEANGSMHGLLQSCVEGLHCLIEDIVQADDLS